MLRSIRNTVWPSFVKVVKVAKGDSIRCVEKGRGFFLAVEQKWFLIQIDAGHGEGDGNAKQETLGCQASQS